MHGTLGAKDGGSVDAICKTEKEDYKTIELEMKTIMDVLSHGTALTRVEKSRSTNLRSQRDQEQCHWDHKCTVTFAGRNDREIHG